MLVFPNSRLEPSFFLPFINESLSTKSNLIHFFNDNTTLHWFLSFRTPPHANTDIDHDRCVNHLTHILSTRSSLAAEKMNAVNCGIEYSFSMANQMCLQHHRCRTFAEAALALASRDVTSYSTSLAYRSIVIGTMTNKWNNAKEKRGTIMWVHRIRLLFPTHLPMTLIVWRNLWFLVGSCAARLSRPKKGLYHVERPATRDGRAKHGVHEALRAGGP